MTNEERAALEHVQATLADIPDLSGVMGYFLTLDQMWRELAVRPWWEPQSTAEPWARLAVLHRNFAASLPAVGPRESIAAIVEREAALIDERIAIERAVRPPRRWHRRPDQAPPEICAARRAWEERTRALRRQDKEDLNGALAAWAKE